MYVWILDLSSDGLHSAAIGCDSSLVSKVRFSVEESAGENILHYAIQSRVRENKTGFMHLNCGMKRLSKVWRARSAVYITVHEEHQRPFADRMPTGMSAAFVPETIDLEKTKPEKTTSPAIGAQYVLQTLGWS